MEAVAQCGAAALQRACQIQETRHGQVFAQLCQRFALIQSAQKVAAAVGRGLHDGQVAGQITQLAQQRAHILAAAVEPVKQHQRIAAVSLQDVLHHLHGLPAAGQTQHIQHGAAVQRAAYHTALIQQAQRVAQRAVCHARENLGPVRGQIDLLRPGNGQKLLLHVTGQDPLKGKTLTAGEDRGRYLVQLRSSQNEHQVLRRLFQRFEQCVKRGGGQHVHLVDDIHAPAQDGRRVDGFFQHGANVVHAAVGGGVQLRHIQQRAVVNAAARFTRTARCAVHGVQAVDRLGEDTGTGGLACTAGTGKKIGMGSTALCHLPLQGIGDVALSHHFGKSSGPPFAIQRLIHTGSFLSLKVKSQ